MRVIAGKFRGRKFVPIDVSSIRPAADRVKGTIFNILQNKLALDGIDVLDLFAGTGSLGIEAISRGAKHVTFVDNAEQSLRVLRANIASLHCEQQCTLVYDDALGFIGKAGGQFALIFADPPYAFAHTDELPQRIFSRQLLKKEGFLIIEHTERTIFPESSLYRLVKKKQFGQTIVSFFIYGS